MIDTALLLAGMLTAAAYFTAATADETELRALADRLYRRVDWGWAQRKGDAVAMGWKPESGFLKYRWEGYSEALLLFTLGLGSPIHPLTESSFAAWTGTYRWENHYGIDVLFAGPLFIHQFAHAWIDFRGIRDAFMREKGCDYFENSRRAIDVQREYAIRNPRGSSATGRTPGACRRATGPGPRRNASPDAASRFTATLRAACPTAPMTARSPARRCWRRWSLHPRSRCRPSGECLRAGPRPMPVPRAPAVSTIPCTGPGSPKARSGSTRA